MVSKVQLVDKCHINPNNFQAQLDRRQKSSFTKSLESVKSLKYTREAFDEIQELAFDSE